MTTIYIVLGNAHYDFSSPIGAYTTLESAKKALAYCERNRLKWGRYDSFEIVDYVEFNDEFDEDEEKRIREEIG